MISVLSDRMIVCNMQREEVNMALKLMYIKSRIILPKAKPTLEVDEADNADNPIDPREELVRRLLEYQRFQKASKVLASMMSMEEQFVKRPPAKLSQKVLPPRNLSVDKLLKTFLSVIEVSDEASIPEVLVSSEVFHVKDKISKILSELEEHDEIKLSEAVVTNSAAEKIAAFLALLELVKRQRIKAEQIIPFAEILISKNDYTHN